MWDSGVLDQLNKKMGSFSIFVHVKNCVDGFTWLFSGIYGPLKGMEEGRCGRSWPQLEGFEMILGAKEVASMWCTFQLKKGIVVGCLQR